MEGHVRGFDSRHWNGVLNDPQDFKFCAIKLTDGIWGDKESTLAKVQFDAAGAKGLKRLFFHFWRYAANQKTQAGIFAKRLAAYKYELPPCMDFEDPNAVKGIQCVDAIDAFGYEVERLLGADILVYSATWWWNTWVGTTVTWKTWNPYNHDLWEADPPPETRAPGLWKDYSIVQYQLDISVPGFNASVDIDYARETWWKKHTFVAPKWDAMSVEDREACTKELAISHNLAT